MGESLRFSSVKRLWLTDVLLCIFLGSLGIHRFYTKSTAIGAAQLVLGLLSCGIVSWMGPRLLSVAGHKEQLKSFEAAFL